MTGIAQEQQRRNRLSADCWQRYAGHRRVVTDLLLGTLVCRSRPALGVLGAGNCNDLDLPRLAARFADVHLVDLDTQALERGIARQNLEQTAGVHVHGGVDLSGCIRLLDRWTPHHAPASGQEIQRLLQPTVPRVPAALDGLAGSMDVVASVCVLSQLLEAVVNAFGAGHASFLEMVFHVRREHLRLMLDLLRDGARGVLITDFVSSDTCPELVNAPPERLLSLCGELLTQRNFFTGLNPMALVDCLRREPVLRDRIGRVDVSSPWTWQYVSRTYAVAAIVFTKLPGQEE